MDYQAESILKKKTDKQTDVLVSIVVITYNSAKYVLETLESINAQTYHNRELIVSDDCSTDSTLRICQEWIEKNSGKFIRAELITAETNTGIPANCNRGVNNAKGEWIKLIAGDDILDKDCITNFIKYAYTNPDASVISSSVQFFEKTYTKENFGKAIYTNDHKFFYHETSAQSQHKMLLWKNYVQGPSTIIKKSAILNVGNFDEKYPFLEDYPMYLKLTKAGYKIFALNKITVFYRRHDASALRQSGNKIFSDIYLKIREFEIDYIYPDITSKERFAKDLEYYRLQFFDRFGLNRETLLFRLLFEITNAINPAKIIINMGLKKSQM
jgi:GT2 family glycosyltransferase